VAHRRSPLPLFCTLLCAILLCAGSIPAAFAFSTVEFLSSLSEDEADQFRAWRQARRAHDARLDAYWDKVEAKRAERRKKRSSRIPFETRDYVMSFPPTYSGPKLSPGVAKKYERYIAEQSKREPSKPKELPTVADYLSAAKSVYNFTPERVSEKEFKRRYALEAIALGLSKEQVVRVYALETGGIGTYDMQAGIHPIRKTGRAISSALGYAQLLDANSVNELSQNGADFIARLTRMARNPNNSPQRIASLKAKIAALQKMHRNVKRVPFQWSAHQAYAKTPAGMGVHVLNIDGDIGPMLQAVKLKSIKDFAAKWGRTNLTGAELEVMNLSGPATGLEVLNPAGQKAPTTNFFARRAYYVNKMVIGLTGEQLIAELNRRMDASIKTEGSREFLDAFDSVREHRESRR
jgi:hypothetical protein